MRDTVLLRAVFRLWITVVRTTEAASHLGDYLARGMRRGERFLPTKSDPPMAERPPAAGSAPGGKERGGEVPHGVKARRVVCFPSPAPWRTWEMWMSGQGLGTSAWRRMESVATIRGE
ncbi:MAG: hypothetical protein ACKOET_08935, partial [Verrucomicrobiota bacterium]